ncbi:RNA-binding protein [Pararobbsia silviterrae]|uniref:RNA-binding protein n=1 Tax=Pararobbsia silviterrae TaxID=1792498 RepID=A0A494XNB1_9BURK|nr:RNA-binding protein [Pararobbsia silviterrae]RKP49599.1 RNA-binding protein [Pararobbsia silviterrae]
MKLWIGNLTPGVTRDAIEALVLKYTGAPCVLVEFIDEQEVHPAALVEVKDANLLTLQMMEQRLNGMFWMEHKLSVHVLSFTDESNEADAQRERERRGDAAP